MPNPWYPQIDGGNGLSFGVTIAHEFGHNFSLQHANLYESHSEKPNSDEGEIIGTPIHIPLWETELHCTAATLLFQAKLT